ncbi:MAG: AAA family ATPase [Coriobacteriia bacterium]|nr:AAA family ATPase [Coriobacteriia bacterium]
MYQRELVGELARRIEEPRKFIQIVIGPRQTGKTTAVEQAMAKTQQVVYFASADDPLAVSGDWIKSEWAAARSLALGPQSDGGTGALLVIDEIQKIENWSAYVKLLWDEDARNDINLRVVLTGSSTLMLRKGMNESLMGRFEVLYSTHWSFEECRDAFGYSLEDFLYYGGYPGSASLIGQGKRWMDFMRDAIVEPTISLDVLQMESVQKPALLRSLFLLGTSYSAQELSLTKIMGQLQDAGSTATLAHYLELLGKAGMLCGLEKYSPQLVRSRKSSPRFMTFDTSLMSFSTASQRGRLESDPSWKGHLVESAVGAYLLARSKSEGFTVQYWRDRGNEVDFVLKKGNQLTCIEVKSGRVKSLDGVAAFKKRYPEANSLVIGGSSRSLEDFLLGKYPLFSLYEA